MEIRFLVPQLVALDTARVDAVAIFVFEDERPPLGAFGWIDWRLAGFLSKALSSEQLKGSYGELTLVPATRRLPGERILIVGLGKQESFDAQVFASALEMALECFERLHIRKVAMGLPGRARGSLPSLLDVDSVASGLVQAGKKHVGIDTIVVLEPAEEQRALEPAIERVRRRLRIQP